MSAPTLMERRPVLRPGVRISDRRWKGTREVYAVLEPLSGRSYEIGSKEQFLVSRLDGRTLGELTDEYAGTHGRALRPENWTQLLTLLHQRSLLDGPVAVAATVPSAQHNRWFAGQWQVGGDVPTAVARWYRRVRWAFHPVFVTLSLVAILVGFVAVAASLPTLLTAAASVLDTPWLAVGVVVLVWLSFALHEWGHALTAQHFGGRTRAMGLRWRLPMLTMFAAVEEYTFLPSRWARFATAAAGAWVNFLLLLPAVAVWVLWQPEGAFGAAVAATVLLGTVFSAVNLLPLPPLDGYQAVSQALGINDLARSSRDHLAQLRTRSGRQAARTMRPAFLHRAYLGYAIAAGLLIALIGGALAVALVVVLHRHAGPAAALGGASIVVFALVGLISRAQFRRRAVRP